MPMYMPGPSRVYSKLLIQQGDPRLVLGYRFQVHIIYDKMKVGEMSEAQYVEEKVAGYNKKKPGKGDEWKINWLDSRKLKYLPAFIGKFNEFGTKTNTSAYSNSDSAALNLTIYTTFTEPGYNAFVAGSPAEIDADCIFTDASGRTILRISAEHVPGYKGLSEDYEITNRITECYAKLGKDLAKKLQKKFKPNKQKAPASKSY